jgi:hypothetical protein
MLIIPVSTIYLVRRRANSVVAAKTANVSFVAAIVEAARPTLILLTIATNVIFPTDKSHSQ